MKRSPRFTRSAVRKPSQAFTQCPECESRNLVCFEGEAICTFCPWNSIELHVEARFSLRTKANAAQAHESQESAPRAGRATRIATDSYDEETSFSELEYSFA